MEQFDFDMGNPISMTQEEIHEILKTIPQETLDEYGIAFDGEGDDTPEEAQEEGKAFALKLAAPVRMIREGYTITDYANYYWFGHGKWSGRGGKKPHHPERRHPGRRDGNPSSRRCC